jgi:2-polyprenyl-3-methyl-5-hydroxy-6-metoxy-1,4-benzoquinol methylase
MRQRNLNDVMARSYPEYTKLGYTRADGTIAFYRRVNSEIRPDSVVLDVGCGRGVHAEDPVRYRRLLRDFRGRASEIIGIDVDPDAAMNPLIHRFAMIDGPTWPIESETIDVCIADFVLEHIPDPDAFFRECRRVLRPGGMLFIRTSNTMSYFGVASRMVPNVVRLNVLKAAQPDRESEDVFPTVYRCNTVARLRKAFAKHNFDADVRGFESEPRYLAFSRVLFRMGVVYQRFAPSAVRSSIFAFARKPVERMVPVFAYHGDSTGVSSASTSSI